MILSVAMMVKNEEKFLERTLKALLPLKSKLKCEIVIVDTGSEDNTVNIAKQYADKVYCESWKNDFAYMRNVSIAHCSGAWILIVDADEVLENPEGITEFFTNKLDKRYNAAAVGIKNLTSADAKDYIMGSLVRLFKNDKGLRYEGRIHEQPKYKGPVVKLNAVFRHYGYNNYDYKLMIYKYERNLKLLMEQLREKPNDIYTLFQLAQTYSMAKKQNETFRVIREAYSLCENKKDGIDEHLYVYHFYAKELFGISDYNKTIEVCDKVIKTKKGYLDFYYLLGNSYDRLGNINKAIEYYNEYLKIRNDYESYEGFKTSSIIDFSHSRKDEILINLFKIRFNEMEYDEGVKAFKQIEDENIKKTMESPFIVCLIMTLSTEDILQLLKVEKIDDEFIENVFMAIEKVNLIRQIQEKELELFRNKNKNLDLAIEALNEEEIEKTYEDINWEKFYLWKANILKKMIKKKYENISLLHSCNRNEKKKYLSYLIKDYEVVEQLVKFIEVNRLNTDLKELVLLIEIEVVLLKTYILSEEKYEKVIYLFLGHNINKLDEIYNHENVTNETVDYISDEQDIVVYKLIYAFSMFENDKVQYLKILRNTIKEYSDYKNIINFLSKMNLEGKITEEIISEKRNLLKIIEGLVGGGEVQKAKEIIVNLYNMFKFDAEILNYYGTIEYILGEFDEALENLNLAFVLNHSKFDTLYNIANVLEAQNRNKDARYYYKKSAEVCEEDDMYEYLKVKIEELDKK